ncbi:hypothetical protein Back11_56980 [Paenibacillus baekrokdamisoli]|uniref:Uncharacterized protein n=1 Tax=Paenibacillus baekrokdamisoli TaxID=1712516 RepID=A0A3G9JHA9_9BACL|nr:hypothetical protein [Paenibacillus baekrokdamisoli]MBB3073425.1 hypothetical protein [Paenibacillus baekrokdamisoli]BBH24353.1 hypothetical protein Back11_56980 [Paenibacillus baekrokdamisoli]
MKKKAIKLIGTLLCTSILTIGCQNEVESNSNVANSGELIKKQLIEPIVNDNSEISPQSSLSEDSEDSSLSSDTVSSEKDFKTITDIASWEHPIKAYFENMGLTRVEFITKEYPVFHVDGFMDRTYTIDDYLSGKLEKMLKANGNWDFAIQTPEHQIRVVSKGNVLSAVYCDEQPLDLKRLRTEYDLIDEVFRARIIKKDDKTGFFYFRDSASNNKVPKSREELYLNYHLFYVKHSDSNEYEIEMPRSTDTVISRFYARIQDGEPVFYGDQSGMELTEDYNQVTSLFTSRFMIAQSKSTGGLYAFKNDQKQFIYDITSNKFLLSERMYVIQVTRTTDHQKYLIYYDADKNKFYMDGSPRVPIKENDIKLQLK